MSIQLLIPSFFLRKISEPQLKSNLTGSVFENRWGLGYGHLVHAGYHGGFVNFHLGVPLVHPFAVLCLPSSKAELGIHRNKKTTEGNEEYRASQLVVDLSWVDWILTIPPVCKTLPWLRGIWQMWLAEQISQVVELSNQSQLNPKPRSTTNWDAL